MCSATLLNIYVSALLSVSLCISVSLYHSVSVALCLSLCPSLSRSLFLSVSISLACTHTHRGACMPMHHHCHIINSIMTCMLLKNLVESQKQLNEPTKPIASQPSIQPINCPANQQLGSQQSPPSTLQPRHLTNFIPYFQRHS